MKTSVTVFLIALAVGVAHDQFGASPAPSKSGKTPAKTSASIPPPPVTEKKPVTEDLHGVSITDNYRWLEDQDSPATRAWIDKENAYTDTVLKNMPKSPGLEKRLTELNRTDTVTTPTVRGGRYFFTRRGADQDLFSIYMRERADGPDILLIDPHPMSADHTTSVGIQDVSQDGKLLVYDVRLGGVDETTLRVFDVDSKKDVEQLPLSRYLGVSIAGDGKDVYYSTHSPKTGPRVWHHRLGSDPSKDEMIFGEGYGPEKIIGVQGSDDGRFLIIEVFYGSAPKKTEIYLENLAASGPVTTVVKDLDCRSSAQMAGDDLVIRTNWNAPNDRVMVAPAASPTRENWRELVPEDKGAAIEEVTAVGGRVFVQYLENVKPKLVAYALDGKRTGEVELPGLGSLTEFGGDWHHPEAFYTFSSFALPPTIYAYDVSNGKRSVFASSKVPVDPEKFETRQVWYTSKDGTKVPMFLMYRKGLKPDHNTPVYMTGYGGFDVSELPSFRASAVVWAEHGGIYALPSLRGGGEFGESWHSAGMLANKQHVFDDLYAAAEYLVHEGLTSHGKLSVSGGSNGGLLVGAAMTQRPELFRAIVCSYPLLDMVRFDQFLVGSFWVPEYGTAKDAEQFKWIYAYSPYQHVAESSKYPAVLFISGDGDSRVAPLHARKMTAEMQAANRSGHPILLRYHTSSGHSGGEPVSVQVKNAAESLNFLFWQLGVK